MNKITDLLKIKYPIIQGGMVWCCGWRLAAAVSANGGLGLLGAGSMTPDVLREHIQKCRAATSQPFGVNVPLIYQEVEGIMRVITEEKVPVVFSSAGNPKTWTKRLKDNGITVVHVVSSSKFAQKAEEAGVDAIVAEGFEAGGHNGREETTTMALIPQVRRATSLPLIAAGGIATGEAMLAAFCLGADGVQIGTRFALSEESSASPEFKRICTETVEGGTSLLLKKLSPTRMIKNAFYSKLQAAEDRGASAEELLEIIGKGRSKLGIFEGNLEEGELEIGQVASLIKTIQPVETIFKELLASYNLALGKLKPIL
jgi:enoyl-[acyl-carrier protein] reductase II